MSRKIMFLVSALILIASAFDAAQATATADAAPRTVSYANSPSPSTWKRYIPAAERKAVFGKATRSTGLGAKFISKVNARVLWVTDEVARAVVSDMLDRKVISENEADWEYFELRPEKHFLFILFIKTDKKTPWGPLDKKNFSLYKDNDPENRLSEGEATEAYFNAKLRDALDVEFDVKGGKQYFAHVLRRNASGEPVIKDLQDAPQAMFSLQGKEVYLRFPVNELVTNVKDL